MANLNFNPNAHEPSDPNRVAGEVFPAGWYAMQIVESEMKETSSGPQMLVLTFEMVEAAHPQLKGRRIWVNLNLYNPNPKTVEIAQRDLSAICKAIGQMGELSDSNMLHNRPMAVKAKVKPAKGEYEARNEATAFDSASARFANGVPQPASTMSAPPATQATPPVTPPAQQVPPAGQPGQTQTPPWMQ